MDLYLEVAADINRRLTTLLAGLRQGTDDHLRNDHGCIRWDVVESTIHAIVTERLTTSDSRPATPGESLSTVPPSGQLIRAGTFRCADEAEPVHGYLVASDPDTIRRVSSLPMYRTVLLVPQS